ncbi:MAG: 30S ribosome-binding factor RbfA [Methylococcales bacterium]|nr:30S ribosome-binding factor RbfA [Methylococcales bacterium]MBT7445246.1 30S ribosome-binding factor RbfA [Methylococcales bacterium]
MAKAFDRSKRVASQIQKELSVLIRDRLGDPRLALLTISEVNVSRDFSYAKIYYRLMGDIDDKGIAESEDILSQASRFLRKELGHSMRLRSVPQLRFFYDRVVDTADQLEKLIAAAVSDDQQKHSG